MKQPMFIFRQIKLLVFLLSVSSTTFAQTTTDKYLLFTSQYPPYEMSSDGSQFAHDKESIIGICTEVIKSLMDKANIHYQMRLRVWSHAYERVQRNEKNGIFCVVRNEEREDLFRWVGPIADMEWSLFAMKDAKITLRNIEQAKQYRIGGAKNDVISNYLIAKGLDVSVIFNDMKNPIRLKTGSIDLWASDSVTGPYLAADVADVTKIEKVLTFQSKPMYLGMSLDVDSEVIQRLNNILKEMQQSGEVDAIRSSYGL